MLKTREKLFPEGYQASIAGAVIFMSIRSVSILDLVINLKCARCFPTSCYSLRALRLPHVLGIILLTAPHYFIKWMLATVAFCFQVFLILNNAIMKTFPASPECVFLFICLISLGQIPRSGIRGSQGRNIFVACDTYFPIYFPSRLF